MVGDGRCNICNTPAAYSHHPTAQLCSGYGCHGLDPSYHNLQIVSGAYFLPSKMCMCLEGWSGAGTTCRKCDNSSYNENVNATYCTPCPDQGNTGRPGASSVSECKCSKGRSLVLVRNQTACGCGKSHALGDEECVNCAELHLNCSEEDSNLRTVPPSDGFARLDPWLQRDHEIRTIDALGAPSPNLLRLI